MSSRRVGLRSRSPGFIRTGLRVKIRVHETPLNSLLFGEKVRPHPFTDLVPGLPTQVQP